MNGSSGFPLGVASRYMFDINATVVWQWVGESPKGKRMDIQYPSGNVSTDENKYQSAWWDTLGPDMRNRLTEVFQKCGIDFPGHSVGKGIEQFRDLERFHGGDQAAAAFRRECLEKLRDGNVTPLEWYGFQGKVISGSNWATVRADIVAEFSGRVTLQSDDEDGALIDAIFAGIIDLDAHDLDVAIFRNTCFANPRAEAAQKRARNGSPWPTILIPVTFDVGRAAQKWAPKRYIRHATGYWKYQRLTQGQFIALGNVGVGNELAGSHEVSATLTVYEIRPKSA